MTKTQKQKYESPDNLREFLRQIKGKKYRLDCGHHWTPGYFLGNDITIYNGKDPKIICSQCGY
jgi:hypothetical protein